MQGSSTATFYPTPKSPLKIAALISGTGRTLRNVFELIETGRLDAGVVLVQSSTPQARGLQYAETRAVPIDVVERRDYDSPEEFSEAVFGPCRDFGADLVVMAGYLKHVLIPTDFENRVMNIHPGLVPAFCGKGFYGHHVHEAAIKYGVKVSGCTVHFVDNEYDHGPIILQKTVPVHSDDSPDVLAARVFEAECEAYPEAVRLYGAGKIRVEGRKVIAG